MMQAEQAAAPALLEQSFELFGDPRINPVVADLWYVQQSIALQERALHLVEAITDGTLQQIAQLLNPRQVRAYAESQAADIQRRRDVIAAARSRANLPDTIAAPPAPAGQPIPTT